MILFQLLSDRVAISFVCVMWIYVGAGVPPPHHHLSQCQQVRLRSYFGGGGPNHPVPRSTIRPSEIILKYDDLSFRKFWGSSLKSRSLTYLRQKICWHPYLLKDNYFWQPTTKLLLHKLFEIQGSKHLPLSRNVCGTHIARKLFGDASTPK